ncbi:MAG: Holliday junction branch migration protein RuvA [Calditrichia bacterium]
MIEQIRGQLIQTSPTFCVVDCHGIGLGLFISVNTFRNLGEGDGPVKLLTHLHVREDLMQLYGFSDSAEREMFRQLINVSGIGPRLALTVLSGLTASELARAIATEDLSQLTKIPGIGKKTAQRLVLELKEKVRFKASLEQSADLVSPSTEHRDKIEEAILALITLGYRQVDAKKAVENIVQHSSADQPLDEIIKSALKEI